MSRLPPFEPPQDWGADELTFMMEQAHRNRVVTFKNKPEFRRLIGINNCYQTVSANWTNPQDPVAALLLIRSHSAFLSACEMAASTAVADAFPHIRACLEYAAYALHINRNPSLREIWLRRHDDAPSRANVRREFALANLRASISACDRHADANFHRLYEESIDFGAHPNERAVTGSLEINQTETGREYKQLLFHGDGMTLDHVLISTSRAGICALQILQNVFGPRFELLGVNAEILQLRAGL